MGGNANLGAEAVADEGQVDGAGGDDDLCWAAFGLADLADADVASERASRRTPDFFNVPTEGSSLAALRFWTISLMDETVPFLGEALVGETLLGQLGLGGST